jgi:hypothetical protein
MLIRRLRARPSVTKYVVGSRTLASVWKKLRSGARNIVGRACCLAEWATR